MIFPEIDTESTRIHEDGELPKGLYFYALTGIDERGNESYPHIIQVYARFDNNTINISWKVDPKIVEYRLYRGKSLKKFDGFFSFSPEGKDICDFYDNGLYMLNEFCTLRL